MDLSAEQLHIASRIDAKVQRLLAAGNDDVTIFAEMADDMPAFKRLMDTSEHGAMDELCQRFAGLYRYAKILETGCGRLSNRLEPRPPRRPCIAPGRL